MNESTLFSDQTPEIFPERSWGEKICGNHYVSFLRGDRILSMDCPGSIIRYTLRTGCPTLNQLMSWDFHFDAHKGPTL